MSHSSKIFESQPIKVQNLNGFDLSHLNSGTAYCGTLTPVLTYLAMQETHFSLGCALQVELPPLATQAFGRVDAHVEVFFCPCSILYGGWKQFIDNNPETSFIASQSGYEEYDLPRFSPLDLEAAAKTTVSTLDASNYCLLDYVGLSTVNGVTLNAKHDINLMSLLAYHKIWDVFYRNPQVTRTIFAVNPMISGPGFAHSVAYIHHSYLSFKVSGGGPGNINTQISDGNPFFWTNTMLNFPDGISVFSLRQRNYGNDYFTAGSLKPFQNGNNPAIEFTVDAQGDGSITLSGLRQLNSIGKFLEANNYSADYRSIQRANYGRTPSDAGVDEPVYLGRLVVPIYQKGIFLSASAGMEDGFASASGNPFISGNGNWAITGAGALGAKAAHGSFNGSGEICKNFRCGTWGYIMGIFSLVPHAQYSYGMQKHLSLTEQGDFARPLLQSVGMDAIKTWEVYATDANLTNEVDFSYIGRFSGPWKYVDDTVHGELRPRKSLDSFVIQRVFSSVPSFSTSFLEIPTSALDKIFAANSEDMKFSCWYEIYWVFKAVMPLAEFCVPTLGELQDVHTIRVKQGGSRL